MTVLIIEDEDTIREFMRVYLERENFDVLEAADGEAGLVQFKKNKVDLVLLDLNLPKIDGIEVCKQIRKISAVPIIMVTARVEEIDELLGLEIGADDYIRKPFSPNILIARIRSRLRRMGNEAVVLGDLHIDPEKMIVTKKKKKINLTTTQFNILYTLAKHPGKVYTRNDIMDGAYDNYLPNDIYDRTVDAHIKSIRKAIEDNTRKPKYIITVIGKGYKCNEDF